MAPNTSDYVSVAISAPHRPHPGRRSRTCPGRYAPSRLWRGFQLFIDLVCCRPCGGCGGEDDDDDDEVGWRGGQPASAPPGPKRGDKDRSQSKAPSGDGASDPAAVLHTVVNSMTRDPSTDEVAAPTTSQSTFQDEDARGRGASDEQQRVEAGDSDTPVVTTYAHIDGFNGGDLKPAAEDDRADSEVTTCADDVSTVRTPTTMFTSTSSPSTGDLSDQSEGSSSPTPALDDPHTAPALRMEGYRPHARRASPLEPNPIPESAYSPVRSATFCRAPGRRSPPPATAPQLIRCAPGSAVVSAVQDVIAPTSGLGWSTSFTFGAQHVLPKPLDSAFKGTAEEVVPYAPASLQEHGSLAEGLSGSAPTVPGQSLTEVACVSCEETSAHESLPALSAEQPSQPLQAEDIPAVQNSYGYIEPFVLEPPMISLWRNDPPIEHSAQMHRFDARASVHQSQVLSLLRCDDLPPPAGPEVPPFLPGGHLAVPPQQALGAIAPWMGYQEFSPNITSMPVDPVLASAYGGIPSSSQQPPSWSQLSLRGTTPCSGYGCQYLPEPSFHATDSAFGSDSSSMQPSAESQWLLRGGSSHLSSVPSVGGRSSRALFTREPARQATPPVFNSCLPPFNRSSELQGLLGGGNSHSGRVPSVGDLSHSQLTHNSAPQAAQPVFGSRLASLHSSSESQGLIGSVSSHSTGSSTYANVDVMTMHSSFVEPSSSFMHVTQSPGLFRHRNNDLTSSSVYAAPQQRGMDGPLDGVRSSYLHSTQSAGMMTSFNPGFNSSSYSAAPALTGMTGSVDGVHSSFMHSSQSQGVHDGFTPGLTNASTDAALELSATSEGAFAGAFRSFMSSSQSSFVMGGVSYAAPQQPLYPYHFTSPAVEGASAHAPRFSGLVGPDPPAFEL